MRSAAAIGLHHCRQPAKSSNPEQELVMLWVYRYVVILMTSVGAYRLFCNIDIGIAY